jgi:hypothetical protein
MKFAVSFALGLLLSLTNAIPVSEAGKPLQQGGEPPFMA